MASASKAKNKDSHRLVDRMGGVTGKWLIIEEKTVGEIAERKRKERRIKG